MISCALLHMDQKYISPFSFVYSCKDRREYSNAGEPSATFGKSRKPHVERQIVVGHRSVEECWC